MAYWIQNTSISKNNGGFRSYVCDYLSDIDKLPRYGVEGEPQGNDSFHKPCAYGSACLCLEDGGSKWILGKDTNKWQKLNKSISGGGSGGTIDESMIATNDEVDAMLDDIFGKKQ